MAKTRREAPVVIHLAGLLWIVDESKWWVVRAAGLVRHASETFTRLNGNTPCLHLMVSGFEVEQTGEG